MQLPDTVTNRVYELAHEITDSYNSDYDKAKAIESYLRTLEYTLKPGNLPDGYDFVDYFLFEGKKDVYKRQDIDTQSELLAHSVYQTNLQRRKFNIQ